MCCTGTSCGTTCEVQVLVVVPHVRYRYEWWYHMCCTGTSCGTTCAVQVLVVVPHHVLYRY